MLYLTPNPLSSTWRGGFFMLNTSLYFFTHHSI